MKYPLDEIHRIQTTRDNRAAARLPASSMSDSKWRKALESLASTNAGDLCEWKFVREKRPKRGRIPSADQVLERWVEPHCIDITYILVPRYKDLEWLELLGERLWQDYKNAPISSAHQNLESAEAALRAIGRFDLERTLKGLRIYGYRRSAAA